MKKSSKKPPVTAAGYGRSLVGLTVNLLSVDLPRALVFQRDVLQADIVHQDEDLIIAGGFGSGWMVHADHTYDNHPLLEDTRRHKRRGAGIELRLHRCDPDDLVERALLNGFSVLDGPRDQPDHGLREAHVIDQDGYVWVADIALE